MKTCYQGVWWPVRDTFISMHFGLELMWFYNALNLIQKIPHRAGMRWHQLESSSPTAQGVAWVQYHPETTYWFKAKTCQIYQSLVQSPFQSPRRLRLQTVTQTLLPWSSMAKFHFSSSLRFCVRCSSSMTHRPGCRSLSDGCFPLPESLAFLQWRSVPVCKIKTLTLITVSRASVNGPWLSPVALQMNNAIAILLWSTSGEKRFK